MCPIKKIKKILIPNRGEIALRIQRTCRDLDILTVSVFSDPDRDALHVRYADQAYAMPGSSAKDTYLNQDLILDIARQSGADAIHPGYGFLSENAGFAKKCAERGFIFIGPPPEAIERMGIKTEAQRLMRQAGIPVVPGTEIIQTSEAAAGEAKQLGYPVLVKASAGGGGKGMRLVERPEMLQSAIETCRREALSAFGDPEIYIEKYLPKTRHVEFQILADNYGNIIHLFERECSIQRRHQKIIEETPSPLLNEELRRRMGDAAVKAAHACGYTNAGTIEFLLDTNKNFYFLEMNTRLQVEHPITEMITGIDLVERQIRIAEGERMDTGLMPRRGAAIECRIYAEDPEKDFLPSPGLIKGLTEPGGPGVRNDSWIYPGVSIPMEYDPIIAKVVTWGENRNQALNRMLRALEEYRLLGIRTNISYLRKIIRHPEFASGNYDTSFISENGKSLLEHRNDEEKLEFIALAAAGILHFIKSESPSIKKRPQKNSQWKLSDRPPQLGGMD